MSFRLRAPVGGDRALGEYLGYPMETGRTKGLEAVRDASTEEGGNPFLDSNEREPAPLPPPRMGGGVTVKRVVVRGEGAVPRDEGILHDNRGESAFIQGSVAGVNLAKSRPMRGVIRREYAGGEERADVIHVFEVFALHKL